MSAAIPFRQAAPAAGGGGAAVNEEPPLLLLPAEFLVRYAMPADDGAEGGDGTDDASAGGSGQSGADGGASGTLTDPDDTDGDGTEEAGEDDGMRDKEIKALHEEAKRHRLAKKAAEGERDAALATVKELKVHNAFLLSAAGKVNDITAAWKLADVESLELDDDGNVTGTDDVVATLLERYPYLVPDEATDSDDEGLYEVTPEPSGRPANGRRQVSNEAANRKILEAKFPALRHRPR